MTKRSLFANFSLIIIRAVSGLTELLFSPVAKLLFLFCQERQFGKVIAVPNLKEVLGSVVPLSLFLGE